MQENLLPNFSTWSNIQVDLLNYDVKFGSDIVLLLSLNAHYVDMKGVRIEAYNKSTIQRVL